MKLDGVTSASRAPLTPQEVNERNHRFWQVHSDVCRKRISDESLFDIAREDMHSEIIRGVSVRSRKTLGQALADAEMTKDAFQRAFSRKGGSARKCDALQRLVLRIVRRKPKINNQQLLHRLKEEAGEGAVISIDGKSDVLAGGVRKIHFWDDDGTEDTASLSGLKDRLSRAKKNIRGNRLARRSKV